jgi:hypothetical protein
MDSSRGERTVGSIRERLTFANVMASVALFIALGGASYAAVALPDNSVGSKQLRRHAVKQADLAAASVGTRQLRRRAVTAPKLAGGSVRKRSLSSWIRGQLRRRAAAGAPGARGPQGPTGPRGPGAVAIRYAAESSGTPNPVAVLDTGGLRVSASCDLSPGGTTLNFSVRSAETATLYETVTVDTGTDPTGPPTGASSSNNLQIGFQAGVTQNTGGPSATDGFARVAVQGVYSSPSTTIDLHLFALVIDGTGADPNRCSINGVAVPT